MKYSDEEDNLLVDMVCETNEEARDNLYKKYESTIEGIVKRYKNKAKKIGIDINDLIQEANLGFTDAINKYDRSKEASLKTFITLCIDRRLIKVIEHHSAYKNKLLQESLSLDYEYQTEGLPLKEIIGDNTMNPDKTFLEKEDSDTINKEAKKHLSTFEYLVYQYMLKEMTYNEIAKVLSKSPKQIDNTMQRVRVKMKELMKERKK